MQRVSGGFTQFCWCSSSLTASRWWFPARRSSLRWRRSPGTAASPTSDPGRDRAGGRHGRRQHGLPPGPEDRPGPLEMDAPAQGPEGLRLGALRAGEARRRPDLHGPLHPLGTRGGQLRGREPRVSRTAGSSCWTPSRASHGWATRSASASWPARSLAAPQPAARRRHCRGLRRSSWASSSTTCCAGGTSGSAATMPWSGECLAPKPKKRCTAPQSGRRRPARRRAPAPSAAEWNRAADAAAAARRAAGVVRGPTLELVRD